MFEVLDKCVKVRKNIRVAYSSPGKRLVQDESRAILGSSRNVITRKSVSGASRHDPRIGRLRVQ